MTLSTTNSEQCVALIMLFVLNDLLDFTQQPCLLQYIIMLFLVSERRMAMMPSGFCWRITRPTSQAFSCSRHIDVRTSHFVVNREGRCQHTERGGAACVRSVAETGGWRFDGIEPYESRWLFNTCVAAEDVSSLDDCSSGGVSFVLSVEDENDDVLYLGYYGLDDNEHKVVMVLHSRRTRV